MEFSEGYIEETGFGLTCVGAAAVEVGIILRKTGATLAEFKKVFESQVEIIKAGLINK